MPWWDVNKQTNTLNPHSLEQRNISIAEEEEKLDEMLQWEKSGEKVGFCFFFLHEKNSLEGFSLDQLFDVVDCSRFSLLHQEPPLIPLEFAAAAPESEFSLCRLKWKKRKLKKEGKKAHKKYKNVN